MGQHTAALSLDDLAANEADFCGTVAQQFDDVEFHEIPPNGQGIASCMALGIVAHTPIWDLGPERPEALCLIWEAVKLAFRDFAAYVADPTCMNDIQAKDLLDPAYLPTWAKLIDPMKAQDFKSGAPRQCGTVCLLAADSSGMMISFIQLSYAGFGSGVVIPGSGIHLQNRGCGFSLQTGHPNIVAPRSSLCILLIQVS